MSIRSRISQATKSLLGREERSVPLPFEGVYQAYGMPHSFPSQDAMSSYDDNPWLAGAVDRIAQTLSRTKFHLQRVNAKGEIEIIKSHQALETLKRPQPTKGGKSLLTGMDLKLVTAYHLCLEGEAFWILDKRLRVNGAPTFIDLLIPQHVYPTIKNGELVKYVYRLPEQEIEYAPEDVVHFKLPGIQHWQRGQSPVKPLRFAVDTHREADKMNLNKIRNGAVPGGTLETDQPVIDTERKKILAQWNQSQAGSRNAGKTAMLPNGLHFNKTQESNADMQYTEGKRMNREEILARYGVGPEILGMTDSQTRANAEAAIFIFMKFGASFFIEKYADTLDNDFSSQFPGLEDATWAYPDPVPENMEEKRLNAQTLFSLGAATPNELRKQFGFEPLDVEGMDMPYLDMGKVPIGMDPLTL